MTRSMPDDRVLDAKQILMCERQSGPKLAPLSQKILGCPRSKSLILVKVQVQPRRLLRCNRPAHNAFGEGAKQQRADKVAALLAQDLGRQAHNKHRVTVHYITKR